MRCTQLQDFGQQMQLKPHYPFSLFNQNEKYFDNSDLIDSNSENGIKYPKDSVESADMKNLEESDRWTNSEKNNEDQQDNKLI